MEISPRAPTTPPTSKTNFHGRRHHGRHQWKRRNRNVRQPDFIHREAVRLYIHPAGHFRHGRPGRDVLPVPAAAKADTSTAAPPGRWPSTRPGCRGSGGHGNVGDSNIGTACNSQRPSIHPRSPWRWRIPLAVAAGTARAGKGSRPLGGWSQRVW